MPASRQACPVGLWLATSTSICRRIATIWYERSWSMARKKHSPEQRQQPKGTSIVGEGTDKVVAPDVIRMFRTKPHARTVVQPQPASWLLLRRHFQPFPPPDPLHPVPSHIPTRSLQHRRDPAIAVTTILARQLDDRSRQRVFIVALGRDVPLRPSPLPQQPARTPLGKPMMPSGMLYRPTPPFRAQKLASATSFKTCFSSDSSVTSRRKRAFSFSSCFIRRACSSFRPPYSLRQR